MNRLQASDDVEILDLTIRFSASIPDLLLSTPNDQSVTTAAVKQEIRSNLPNELANRRIRLIHAGKALTDDAPLTTVLKKGSSQASSRAQTPVPGVESGTSKGKTPIRNPPKLSRIYIHCSIGDVVLSPADLAAEAALARPQPHRSTDPSALFEAAGQNVDRQTPSQTVVPSEDGGTTAAAPRGFDRLLAAGFTAQEVQNLRLQFLAIQAYTHTPDSMPSPNTLRDMEDRWLDNTSSSAGAAGAEGVGQQQHDDDEGAAGQIDDIVWGSAMGFFWPVGCLLWAFRERGIWSRRRKMAVVVGLLVNMAFGMVRWMR